MVCVRRYHENFAPKSLSASDVSHVTDAQADDLSTQHHADNLLKKRMAEEGIEGAPRPGMERTQAALAPPPPKHVDPVRGMLDTVAVLMSRQLRGKCETMFHQVREGPRLAGPSHGRCSCGRASGG